MGQAFKILMVILGTITVLAGCSQQYNPLTPEIVFPTNTPVPTATPAPTEIPYTNMYARYHVSYFGPCMGGMYTFEKAGNTYTRYNYCQYTDVTTTAAITAADFARQVFSADFKSKTGVTETTVPVVVPTYVPVPAYKCYSISDVSGTTTMCEDSNGVVIYENYLAAPGILDANSTEFLQEYTVN